MGWTVRGVGRSECPDRFSVSIDSCHSAFQAQPFAFMGSRPSCPVSVWPMMPDRHFVDVFCVANYLEI